MDGDDRVADVVVVGAGPGGMGAAYYAARLGLSVALLERERLPRDRICGDGFLAQTVSEMERLGLGDWLLEPQHGVIEGFAVRTRNAGFQVPLPPDPRASRGYIARRPEFEPKIMERVLSAGVRVYDGVEATAVLRSRAGEVSGVMAREVASGETTRLGAPLVVAAGGWGGFEDASADGRPGMIVSRQYFAGTPDPGWAGRRYLHVWYTRGISALGVGYGRVFYLGDGSANVGVAVYGRNLPDETPAREAAIARLHDEFLAEPEVAGMLFSARPEETVKHRVFRAGGLGLRRHAQGLLRVGDAAGTSHPVSGEGIGFALQAGRLAAGWAHEAHRRRDFSANLLSGYPRQLRALRSLRQTSTHALAALVTRLPHLDLMRPVFEACETDAGLRRALADCLAGNAGASALLRRHPVAALRAAAEAARRTATGAYGGPRRE